MKSFIHLSVLAICLALTGCATQSEPVLQYDLGPSLRPAASPILNGVALSVAEIGAPPGLGSPQMFFRLAYANEQQARPYGNSRWTATPTQLFAQRLKARIAQAGGAAVPAADGAANLPTLRIEADEFIQVFESKTQSSAQVALRVSLYQGRNLLAQKSFAQSAPAPSPDAAGGVQALVSASDAAIAELLPWLAALLKK